MRLLFFRFFLFLGLLSVTIRDESVHGMATSLAGERVRDVVEATTARRRNGVCHNLSIAELEARKPVATEWLARAVANVAMLRITLEFLKLDFGDSLCTIFLIDCDSNIDSIGELTSFPFFKGDIMDGKNQLFTFRSGFDKK